MSKGESTANQSFTSHVLCFPLLLYKDLRLAQKGESTYLNWATFDNWFHFTQHTVLILMSNAVSVHLATPLFHIHYCITASNSFNRGTRQGRKSSSVKRVVGPNQKAADRQAFPHTGRSLPVGGDVFTTTFQSSIEAIWCQLKVTKTLTLPYAAAALQTTESDFGSGTIKPVPKNVPSVHMFQKVHFFYYT